MKNCLVSHTVTPQGKVLFVEHSHLGLLVDYSDSLSCDLLASHPGYSDHHSVSTALPRRACHQLRVICFWNYIL